VGSAIEMDKYNKYNTITITLNCESYVCCCIAYLKLMSNP